MYVAIEEGCTEVYDIDKYMYIQFIHSYIHIFSVDVAKVFSVRKEKKYIYYMSIKSTSGSYT